MIGRIFVLPVFIVFAALVFDFLNGFQPRSTVVRGGGQGSRAHVVESARCRLE